MRYEGTDSGIDSATAQLEEFIRRGYEVYLVAGIPGAGKTQFLASYSQGGFLLDRWAREGRRVLPTSVESLNSYSFVFESGRRKIIFLDAAGERFTLLYPRLHGREITESHIKFLRLISRRLKGFVFLLDLESLWGAAGTGSHTDAAQINILSWLLELLRWLLYDGKHEPGPISLETRIDASVRRMRKRLRFPVLVLFSKADLLPGLPVPNRVFQGDPEIHRTLYPPGENPLLLAYHLLPELFESLRTHANYFHFDFSHSLVTHRDTSEVIDAQPCGVDSSLRWLLDSSWRWPRIPTRYFVAIRRLIAMIARNNRWRRLPAPDELTS